MTFARGGVSWGSPEPWDVCEGLFSPRRDFLQSHMIFGLVETLSPALDSKFQKARRELSQKLRELTEQPPMVRKEGRRPRAGANGASAVLGDECWHLSLGWGAWR